MTAFGVGLEMSQRARGPGEEKHQRQPELGCSRSLDEEQAGQANIGSRRLVGRQPYAHGELVRESTSKPGSRVAELLGKDVVGRHKDWFFRGLPDLQSQMVEVLVPMDAKALQEQDSVVARGDASTWEGLSVGSWEELEIRCACFVSMPSAVSKS
ncbi:unnamed protein product [Clonostachys solani]|uniref:Uncharacterized protein n=1 Tax=Clonostachys solani TaxID=160281 RepID=A0A9N9ZLM9_9HYPO|nr:unnamed protein product [Clonostachys solani]